MQKTNKTLLMIALLTSAMAFGTLSITGQTRSKLKPKTITGYFCGGGYSGQLFAYKLLRTPQGVMKFDFIFKRGVSDDIAENTPFYGFNKKGALKIGAEYIVKFFTNNDGEHDAQSFTFSGKVKKTRSCSVE